jgi:hypothetical protein
VAVWMLSREKSLSMSGMKLSSQSRHPVSYRGSHLHLLLAFKGLQSPTRLLVNEQAQLYEEFYLLEYNAVWFLALAYSSIPNLEATCSSETSTVVQRTTRRYIPEDGILIITAVRTSIPTNTTLPFHRMYI